MLINYDPTVDAAYIHLTERNSSAFAFTYTCDPAAVQGQIHLDFDISGQLVGIEIIPASKMLPESLLKNNGISTS
jgi:uncharacterized protein YuzE